jgi:hypothetical protein
VVQGEGGDAGWSGGSPTAQVPYREAATPKSGPKPGLRVCCHFLPFQCSVRVCCTLGRSRAVYSPTAQMLMGEMAAAPYRAFKPEPGSGLGTRLHLVPFQCKMRVRAGANPLSPWTEPESPTAQALVADVAATALSSEPAVCDPAPGLGVGTTLQAWPRQRSVSVRGGFPGRSLPLYPTAHALVRDVAATAFRAVPAPGTCFHLVPIQCSIKELPTAQASVADVAATLPGPRRAGHLLPLRAVPAQNQ